MPLELGPRAEEMGIVWHHDDLQDLDPDDLLGGRYAPYRCGSCGYEWMADLYAAFDPDPNAPPPA
jgi:hypothetical protein